MEPFISLECFYCTACRMQTLDIHRHSEGHSDGAQVNKHQVLTHSVLREVRRHPIRHAFEDSTFSAKDRHLRIDINVGRATTGFIKLRLPPQRSTHMCGLANPQAFGTPQ